MIDGTVTREIEVGYELPVLQKQLDLVKSRLYSLPTESFHTHHELAQLIGFGSAVPQGIMSYGYMSELCTRFFGESWVYGGTLNVSFVGILRTDHLLTIRGTVKEKVNEGSKTKLVLDLSVENQHGEKVALGTASGLVD